MKTFYDYYQNPVKLSFEDHPFSKSPKHVWVICRYKNQWLLTRHKDRGLEFPGGKVEKGETDIDCIVREVYEETALKIEKKEWIKIGKNKEVDGQVVVFTSVYKGDKNDAVCNDKEIVEWYSVDDLPLNVISNLRWLIPLSLDKIKNNFFKEFIISY